MFFFIFYDIGSCVYCKFDLSYMNRIINIFLSSDVQENHVSFGYICHVLP